MDFLTTIWAKVAGIGALLLALLLALLRLFSKGEQSGAAKVEAKQAQAVVKAQDQANVAQQEVQAKPDGAAAAELEDRWTR